MAENKPTLVVALGGNALLKRGEPLEADIQRKNIELAAKTIAPAHTAMARDSGARQWPAGWTFGVAKQCVCQRHPLSARHSRRGKSGNDWLYAATGAEKPASTA